MENYSQIRPLLSSQPEIDRLRQIEEWSESTYHGLVRTFQHRKDQGFIRECHGDLHLANIAAYNDDVVIFDCLEFNDNLRWIDVMSETAFLMMDLEEHGRHDLSYRFLNRYLQYTGDYEGLRVLRFYKVYRAMVRAKVSCLRQAQAATQQKEKIATQQQFHEYLDFAEHYTHPSVTALIITHGLSGSGKTTVTQPLMEHQDAVRIRSDIERKRLHGLSAQQKSSSGIEADIYSVKASIETYQRLADLSVAIIESGYPVIVDATFLKHDQRSLFQELAREHNIPFVILDFHAPEELLRQWIIERAEVGYDVSEADIPVLEHQQETREPLSKDELQCTVHIDTGQKVDIDEIIIRLNKLIYAAT